MSNLTYWKVFLTTLNFDPPCVILWAHFKGAVFQIAQGYQSGTCHILKEYIFIYLIHTKKRSPPFCHVYTVICHSSP